MDYGLLFGLAALWGSSFVFIKIAVDDIAPATQTAYRTILSVALLWVIFMIIRKPLPRDGRTVLLIFLSGMFGVALPFLLISWGQTVVAPGLTAIFMAIMPLATLLVAHVATKDEKFTANKLVGVLLGVLGVALLVGPTLLSALGGDLLHQGAILAASCCYAVNAVITKFLLHVPKAPLITLTITFALLPIVPFALWQDGGFHLDYELSALLAVALLAIVHTVFAAFVLLLIIQRQGATFFSQINLLVPIFGVLWAFLIFSEQPSINAGVALIIILTGVFVARGQMKTTKTGPSHVSR